MNSFTLWKVVNSEEIELSKTLEDVMMGRSYKDRIDCSQGASESFIILYGDQVPGRMEKITSKVRFQMKQW